MLTPIRIDNRIIGFLGKPGGGGKQPAVIHLHERYGIVQHTTDLGQKFVDAGYVTIVTDLEMGSEAVAALLRELRGEPSALPRFATQLIVRESTARAPSSPRAARASR